MEAAVVAERRAHWIRASDDRQTWHAGSVSVRGAGAEDRGQPEQARSDRRRDRSCGDRADDRGIRAESIWRRKCANRAKLGAAVRRDTFGAGGARIGRADARSGRADARAPRTDARTPRTDARTRRTDARTGRAVTGGSHAEDAEAGSSSAAREGATTGGSATAPVVPANSGVTIGPNVHIGPNVVIGSNPPPGSPGAAGLPLAAPPSAKNTIRKPADYNPKSFDPVAYLPKAEALAQQLIPDAKLTNFEFDPAFPDGRVDLTMDGRDREYNFRSVEKSARPANVPRNVPVERPCMVHVEVGVREIVATIRTTEDCDDKLVRRPKCHFAGVWKQALAAGTPHDVVARVGWLFDEQWFFDVDLEGKGGGVSTFPDRCN